MRSTPVKGLAKAQSERQTPGSRGVGQQPDQEERRAEWGLAGCTGVRGAGVLGCGERNLD